MAIGCCLIPGDEQSSSAGSTSSRDLIAKTKASGRLAFVAYPQEFKSWDAKGYDGVEVYNVYTNALEINPVVMFFDGLWSYRSYPDLLFAHFYRRPDTNLQKLGCRHQRQSRKACGHRRE